MTTAFRETNERVGFWVLSFLRHADAAFAKLADETNEYVAAADMPSERQGRLERLVRELFFADPAPPASPDGRFRRPRHLFTDVLVALTGILVTSIGFAVTVRDPLVFGRAAHLPFALAFLPFVALGLTALRSLSLELSERRREPRRPHVAAPQRGAIRLSR